MHHKRNTTVLETFCICKNSVCELVNNICRNLYTKYLNVLCIQGLWTDVANTNPLCFDLFQGDINNLLGANSPAGCKKEIKKKKAPYCLVTAQLKSVVKSSLP